MKWLRGLFRKMIQSIGSERNPIEHLIILAMENRSFDHYLGSLSLKGRTDVDGITSAMKPLKDKDGKDIYPWEIPQDFPLTAKPPHGWDDAHADWNNGANDGFVKQFQRKCPGEDPRIPMGYYTESTLPVLYSLADEFTICDHWFASLLSSTWPNRKYLHSGRRDQDDDTQTLPTFGFQTRPLYDQLENCADPDRPGRALTWKNYFTDLPFLAFWYGFAAFHVSNFSHIADFVNDCMQDALPTISVIDPPFTLADDHPNHDPRLGQKFIGLIVDALTHSESWRNSVLVILYDEFGGFFDHVSPDQAFEGTLATDNPLGFRVPALIVSPFSKKRYVSKVTYDHTSIMKSINQRWGVTFDETFGRRWDKAPAIWTDCLDFGKPPRPAGTYTGSPPFPQLSWGTGVYDKLATPLDKLEQFLERIFVLPELKALDRRSTMFETLAELERRVVTAKRTISHVSPLASPALNRPSHDSGSS